MGSCLGAYGHAVATSQQIMKDCDDAMVSKCVIVVNWNSGPYLRKCLHAVLNQSIPVEKIIVVDNASTDVTLLKAEDASGRFLM